MKFLKKEKTALLLTVTGILFLILGIWQKEIAVIWTKAVYICMECIGIG